MPVLLSALLMGVTSALVLAAGWRFLAPQNSLAGGLIAVLLFLLHPSILSGIPGVFGWDGLFVMLFVATWVCTEHWSLFMRSWSLAVVYAFGLWVGSSFVLWGVVALIPWVLFNRRPLAAVLSLVTVLFGGLAIFFLSWGIAWLFEPTLTRPLFTDWVHWGGLNRSPDLSLPWCLLAGASAYERLRDMLKNHRSDASTYSALLLIVGVLFTSTNAVAALVGLSAPLMARMLAKKEFLLHRRVRWVISGTFLWVAGFTMTPSRSGWLWTGAAMFGAWIFARVCYRRSRMAKYMELEAICVGAYLGESLLSLIHLF